MKRKMEISELIFKIIAYVFLIIFAIICIYPLIYALAATFSSNDAVNTSQVVLWPVIGNATSGYHIGMTLGAFDYAFKQNQFWINYANTLFVAFFGTVWCLLYSILGAYALSKKRLIGRHGFNFFLVFTMWFAAGVIPQYQNYQDTGVIMSMIFGGGGDMYAIDLKWLVILAMGMNATNIILLRNTFEGVPSEIEEAARIDGATEMQILTKVYIPMSKATIATVALFFGISRWNGYFWAMRVMDTKQSYSWPIQVYIRDFIESYTDLTGVTKGDTVAWTIDEYSGVSVAYAMVICAMIPILVIYPFIQKYFAKGVNMGGVKE